jgi:hypothetical protein
MILLEVNYLLKMPQKLYTIKLLSKLIETYPASIDIEKYKSINISRETNIEGNCCYEDCNLTWNKSFKSLYNKKLEKFNSFCGLHIKKISEPHFKEEYHINNLLENELWKPVSNFEGYFISSEGRLMSRKRGKDKILTGQKKKRYIIYELQNNKRTNILAHILVAENFVYGKSDEKSL